MPPRTHYTTDATRIVPNAHPRQATTLHRGRYRIAIRVAPQRGGGVRGGGSDE
jgi:hypothetical protein